MMRQALSNQVMTQSLLLALAILSAGGCAGPEPQFYAQFERAERAFAEAQSPDDFLRAARLYQEIIESGVVSGPLLYNQGNAFMRAGQRGRAIACYRQAKRYRPRDPHLDANLQYALQGAIASPRRSVLDHILFWQDWISYPAKFQLVLAGALVTFLLGLFGLFAKQHPALRRLAWGTLAMTLLLLFSAGYDWYRFDHIEHGVIVRPQVVARKGNAESYEPAFTQPLAEGTEFEVVERRGDWLLVRLPGSAEGWVTQDDVQTF
jgi:tetratricopeptide (TPR) repeat protein